MNMAGFYSFLFSNAYVIRQIENCLSFMQTNSSKLKTKGTVIGLEGWGGGKDSDKAGGVGWGKGQ